MAPSFPLDGKGQGLAPFPANFPDDSDGIARTRSSSSSSVQSWRARVTSALAQLWAVLVVSIGMAADGYDLMVVDLVIAIVSELHPEAMTPHRKGLMASMAFAGVIAGMLMFGLAADNLGHKCAGVLTALFSFLGCATSACCGYGDPAHMAYQLGACRFLLGMGIGGEWPVSMALGSGAGGSAFLRDAGLQLSSRQMLILNTLLFSTGSVFAPTVGAALLGTGLHLDQIWRLLLIAGSIPALGAFFARMQMGKSQDTKVKLNEEHPSSVRSRSLRSLGLPFNSGTLLACCLMWALQNFVFFGQASFRSLLFQRTFFPAGAEDDSTGREILVSSAHFSLGLAGCSLVVNLGLLLSAEQLDFYLVQLLAFTGFSAVAGLVGLVVRSASSGMLLFLFVLWTVPLTVGGCLSYTIPPQHFVGRGGALSCGIAAATAKAGALVGTATFPTLEKDWGMDGLMLVCCAAGGLGAGVILTLLPRHPPDFNELISVEDSTEMEEEVQAKS